MFLTWIPVREEIVEDDTGVISSVIVPTSVPGVGKEEEPSKGGSDESMRLPNILSTHSAATSKGATPSILLYTRQVLYAIPFYRGWGRGLKWWLLVVEH